MGLEIKVYISVNPGKLPSLSLKKSRPLWLVMDDSSLHAREVNSKMCSLENELELLKYIGETYSNKR